MRPITCYITKDGEEIRLHTLNPEKYPNAKLDSLRINGLSICGQLPEVIKKPVKVRVKIDLYEEED